MLLDSLKDINSVSDLFQYICNVETQLEQSKELNDRLLILNDSLNNKIQEIETELEHTKSTLDFYTHKVEIKTNVDNLVD